MAGLVNLNYNSQSEKMENPKNSRIAVAPQGGPSVSVVGDTYRIIICSESEQTNGDYALIVMLIRILFGRGKYRA
jgi:hypothetical protein